MSPDKPTRHAATQPEEPRDLYAGEAGAGEPGSPAGADAGEGRQEKGSAADSRRHPPHATQNTEAGTVESEDASTDDVPTLPANAQGTDTVSTEEHDQGIDETSMYDRRPEEDKDSPPSTR